MLAAQAGLASGRSSNGLGGRTSQESQSRKIKQGVHRMLCSSIKHIVSKKYQSYTKYYALV